LIADADMSGLNSLWAYLAYILMAQSLLLIPLILSFFLPQRTQSGLSRFTVWMKRHEQTIEIVFALIFGLLFLQIGLELLGI
jgi:hypothetical protein